MTVLFLDIDGVCNSLAYAQHNGLNLWNKVDPEACAIVQRIVAETGCKVVLSSTWRLYPDSLAVVRKEVCEIIDCTPNLQGEGGHYGITARGVEIKHWLDQHPEVERYAILDDNSDMLPGQPLFLTSFNTGLTNKIADNVIEYLHSQKAYAI
jgi:hypothetical protein